MTLIDLDAIKADLEQQMDRANPNWSWNNEAACCDLLEYLDKFPVVDPLKHGYWNQTTDIDGIHYLQCSCCKKTKFGKFKPKFCGNCGAKMDGKDNG